MINADQMRMRQDAIDFVREYGATGRPLAAICHAPCELINAGLVQGRKLTIWPTLQTDLRNAGAEWVEQPVVVDRYLISSRKPADIPQITDAILQMMTEQQPAQPRTA